MPYFIFRLGPLGVPEPLGQAASFREAKARVAELRGAPATTGSTIRMIFAEDEVAAVDALTRPRELDPSLAGDDT